MDTFGTLFSCFLASIWFSSIQGIHPNEVRELKCTDLTPDVDSAWLCSQAGKPWYRPLWNKYALRKLAAGVHGSHWANSHSEHDMLKKGCSYVQSTDQPTAALTNSSIHFFGKNLNVDFMGDSKKAYLRLNKAKPHDWTVVRLVFTNNKTFILATTCYSEEGDAGWMLFSPYSSLPAETLEKVVWHIKSLGFKEENILYNHPTYCKDYANPPPETY